MPELELRYPTGLFPDPDAQSYFMIEAARCVASMMNCRDDDGGRVELNGGNVDVFLVPYGPTDARLEALLVGKISAFGFPDRMRNIQQRLEEIQKGLGAIVKRDMSSFFPIPPDRKLVSLSFLPMQSDTWV